MDDDVLEIRAIKGPLNKKWLQSIASLYGSFDPKYSSLEYVSAIFNKNPFGFSWHVFAENSLGQAVGHFAMIPESAVVNEQSELVSKGEAFLIDEKFRTSLAKLNGKNIPVGFAIPLKLKEFAYEQGSRMLFSLNPDDVGEIHKRCGYKVYDINFKRYYFFLKPYKTTSRLKNLITSGISILQNILIKAYSDLDVEFVNGKNLSSELVTIICQTLKQSRVTGEGWTLKKDAKTIEWYLKTGMLEVAFNKKKPQNFALLHLKPKLLEIVHFNAASKPMLHLAAIVKLAKSRGADQVIFNSYTEDKSLISCGKFLAFIKKSKSTKIYIQIKDNFFGKAENLIFNPFFYSIY